MVTITVLYLNCGQLPQVMCTAADLHGVRLLAPSFKLSLMQESGHQVKLHQPRSLWLPRGQPGVVQAGASAGLAPGR